MSIDDATEEKVKEMYRSHVREIDRTDARMDYLTKVGIFEVELARLIESHCMGAVSDTPSAVLARFLAEGLKSWDVAHREELG